MAGYKALFNKFVQSLPKVWLFTLHNSELEKYWRDSKNFDLEEFLEVDKCKGISDLQPCCNTAKVAEDKPSAENDEAQNERRTKRKELCKECFWLQVFLKILTEGP